MGIYQRGNGWWMTYQSEATDGKRIRLSLNTTNRREAERRYQAIRVDIERGQFNLNSSRKAKFGELCKLFIEKHAAFKRSGWRDEMMLRVYLIPYFKDRRLGAIDQKMIDDYKALRAGQVRPATVNRELALLKTLFNKAATWGLADKNPVKGVELFAEDNQIEHVLRDEEEDRLLAACTGRFTYLRSLIVLALHTGMRRGELLSLKWTNVTLPFGQIVVEAAVAKGKRRRSLPINADARAVLEDLWARRTGEYVFCRINGKPYNKWKVRDDFEDVRAAAGLPDLRFHDLRHTFASRLSAGGADIVTIKDLLGHASITTTMRYAHSNSHKQAVDLLCRRSAGHSTGQGTISSQSL